MVENKDFHDMEPIADDAENLPEFEDTNEEGDEASAKQKLKELREKLANCEEEKKKHLEDIQRTKADFLNSRRRLEEQALRDRERATDKILLELLTLADSFEMGMADKNAWNAIDTKWRTGVEAIQAKLLSILKGNNIEEINPIGEEFNPNEHEAVGEVTVGEEKDAHKVISVLQKGFKRGDTIIRPARVVVGTM